MLSFYSLEKLFEDFYEVIKTKFVLKYSKSQKTWKKNKRKKRDFFFIYIYLQYFMYAMNVYIIAELHGFTINPSCSKRFPKRSRR